MSEPSSAREVVEAAARGDADEAKRHIANIVRKKARERILKVLEQ